MYRRPQLKVPIGVKIQVSVVGVVDIGSVVDIVQVLLLLMTLLTSPPPSSNVR